MGGYKIPRLSVEKTDKQLKDELDKNDLADKETGKEMSKLKERVLAAQPAKSNQTSSFQRNTNKRMAPKPFELAAKRLRQGYSREMAAATVSTPTSASATVRANISSISSIESGERSVVLKSEASDSSDLLVLNAALDDIQKPGQSALSNSSDFELLINATQEAELNNYREMHQIESNTSDSSSSSFMPAPRPRVGTVVGRKRKHCISIDSEVSDLCVDTECCELKEKSLNHEEKSFKEVGDSVGVLFATSRADLSDAPSAVCQDYNVPSAVCQDQQTQLNPGIKEPTQVNSCFNVKSGVCQDQQPKSYPGSSNVVPGVCQDQQPKSNPRLYNVASGVCQDQQPKTYPGLHNVVSGVCQDQQPKYNPGLHEPNRVKSSCNVVSAVCQDQQLHNHPGHTTKPSSMNVTYNVLPGVCQDQQLNSNPGTNEPKRGNRPYSVTSGVCQDQQSNSNPGHNQPKRGSRHYNVVSAVCQDQQPHIYPGLKKPSNRGNVHNVVSAVCQDQQTKTFPGNNTPNPGRKASVGVLFVQGNDFTLHSPICVGVDPLEITSPVGTPQILPEISYSDSPIASPLYEGLDQNDWTKNLSTTTPLPREESVLPDIKTPQTGSPFWIESDNEQTNTPTH